MIPDSMRGLVSCAVLLVPCSSLEVLRLAEGGLPDCPTLIEIPWVLGSGGTEAELGMAEVRHLKE